MGFPEVNAFLNTISAAFLIYAYILIRRREIQRHRMMMLCAFAASILFLISYVIYHLQVGSVRFPGTGVVRMVYLTILLTHTVLATAVPFLAIVTLRRGLRRDDKRHRAIAKYTFPIWLYVNITGVVVYVMLYRLYS
jgi:uncharacterized membrane protein YozB (DUF420 family)